MFTIPCAKKGCLNTIQMPTDTNFGKLQMAREGWWWSSYIKGPNGQLIEYSDTLSKFAHSHHNRCPEHSPMTVSIYCKL